MFLSKKNFLSFYKPAVSITVIVLKIDHQWENWSVTNAHKIS